MACISSSCASLQAGMYQIFIEDDEKQILQNEQQVKQYLEFVMNNNDNYIMKTFVRTVFRFQFKKTELMTHRYYVINGPDNEYHTLSFYGTKMTFYSEGAWALDADLDITSYRMYLAGNNKWDVEETTPERGICVLKTIENIIRKMNSTITYYYKDHINDKANVDNCNTALHETLAENDADFQTNFRAASADQKAGPAF
jgi:hypothetical protein